MDWDRQEGAEDEWVPQVSAIHHKSVTSTEQCDLEVNPGLWAHVARCTVQTGTQTPCSPEDSTAHGTGWDIPFHTWNAVYLSQSSYSLRTEVGRVFGFVLVLFLYLAACTLASQFQGCWALIHSFDFGQSQFSSSEKQTVHLDSDEDSASCWDPPPRLSPPSVSSHLLVSTLAILRFSAPGSTHLNCLPYQRMSKREHHNPRLTHANKGKNLGIAWRDEASWKELGGKGGYTAHNIRKGSSWCMQVFWSIFCPRIYKSLKSNAGNSPGHCSSWCKWTTCDSGRSEHTGSNLATTLVNSAVKSRYSHHLEPSFCLCGRKHLNINFKNCNSAGLENISRKSIPIALF